VTATPPRSHAVNLQGALHSPWAHVAQAAAALAAGMGVGRFVYTPILPLMHAQAVLSAGAGADLAAANYVGYLVGGIVGTFLPRLVRSSTALRGCLVVLTASLAAMPLIHTTVVWLLLRLCADTTSALIFVIAVSSLLSHLRDNPAHLPGWAIGGVGAGMALSGLLVLILRTIADWQAAWWASAGLAAPLASPSWQLRPEPVPQQAPSTSGTRKHEPAHPSLVHRAVSLLHAGGHRLHHFRHLPGRGHRAKLSRLDRQRRVGAGRPGGHPLLRAVGGASAGGPAPVSCWPHWPSKPLASPCPHWSAESQRH
jgi:hypothetical protein